MKVLGLIPARGGSKGIPRKNIKHIAGKPLIAWTIETALKSRQLAAVVVTTDDEEIAQVSRKHGAQVPFMRPGELAGDDTSGVDPVLHALRMLPAYDAVLLMQPTSPLRNEEDVVQCLGLAETRNAPCVVSVCNAETHPHWMFTLDAQLCLRPLVIDAQVEQRQHLPQVYAPNGALYFARTEWLKHTGRFMTSETVAYVMPHDRSVDIDTTLDWKLAELLLTEQKQ